VFTIPMRTSLGIPKQAAVATLGTTTIVLLFYQIG
jgi:hypothetical protein